MTILWFGFYDELCRSNCQIVLVLLLEQKVNFNCSTTKAETGAFCMSSADGVLKVKKFKTHFAQYIFCLVTLLFFK